MASYITWRIQKNNRRPIQLMFVEHPGVSQKNACHFCFVYQSDISDFLIVYDNHCEAARHSVPSHVLWHLKYFY